MRKIIILYKLGPWRRFGYREGAANMDAADLRVFEVVARLGSMGQAAQELNTVQSNVTTRIRRLERELGTDLFRRHPRGVALNPGGRRLLPYAHQVARLLAEARCAVLDSGAPKGPLVIGSLETTTALHLTDLLAVFGAAHPEVDLSLHTGTTCELLEQVLDYRLEGAFVCGPVIHHELQVERVFSEELVLMTTPKLGSLDALAEGGEPRMIVLRRGCSYRQRLEEILARRGFAAPRLLEFGTLEAVFGCVAAGLGVTLLPKALIGKVWREGRVALHTLPARDGIVDTVFVRRRDAYISGALAAFLAEMPRLPAIPAVMPKAVAVA